MSNRERNRPSLGKPSWLVKILCRLTGHSNILLEQTTEFHRSNNHQGNALMVIEAECGVCEETIYLVAAVRHGKIKDRATLTV